MGRIAREIVTFCVGLVLVVLCMVIMSLTIGYDEIAADEGGTKVCPVEFNSWSQERKLAFVEDNEDYLHCYCDEYAAGDSNVTVCDTYHEALIIARLFRTATAVCCCFCAVLVDALLVGAQSMFEKAESVDSREKSIMWRSLILKILIYGNPESVFIVLRYIKIVIPS